MPLAAGNLTDDAKQLRHMRPELGGSTSALHVCNLKHLTTRDEFAQLNTTPCPTLRLRLAILPSLIVWLAAMTCIPVQKCITLLIVGPNSCVTISDKCSHARGCRNDRAQARGAKARD